MLTAVEPILCVKSAAVCMGFTIYVAQSNVENIEFYILKALCKIDGYF